MSAATAHFHDGADILKACFSRYGPQTAGKTVIINMDNLAAIITDHEDTIMQAIGMGVGNIGIGAFNATRQIIFYKQIQYAINTVWRGAFSAFLAHQIGHIIGRGWGANTRKDGKNGGAHFGPSLALGL